MAPPSRRRRRIAARASSARRQDGADSRRWHGCRCRARAPPRRHARRRRSIALSRRVPTSRRASSGNATGVGAAPPTPKVARVQCPSSSTATWAAAATMAKSPWRRLISVKAEPVLRLAPDRPLDFLETLVGRNARRHRALQRTRRPAASACRIWRAAPAAPPEFARPAAAPPTGRHAPGCRRRCRDCGSAHGRRTPAPAAAAARRRRACRRAGCRIAACTRPCARRPCSSATNFSAAISLMSISQAGRSSRNAIIGTRLCPPAMTLASSPCCDSSSQASSIEAARAYSNGGDFNLRPQDAASPISRRLGRNTLFYSPKITRPPCGTQRGLFIIVPARRRRLREGL